MSLAVLFNPNLRASAATSQVLPWSMRTAAVEAAAAAAEAAAREQYVF